MRLLRIFRDRPEAEAAQPKPPTPAPSLALSDAAYLRRYFKTLLILALLLYANGNDIYRFFIK